MFTLYMELVVSSRSVGCTECRIISSIYWMTHVAIAGVRIVTQDVCLLPVSVESSEIESEPVYKN